MQFSCCLSVFVALNVRGLHGLVFSFIPLKFSCLLAEKRELTALIVVLIVMWLSMFCSLTCGVVGCPAVCGCSISWSYSFFSCLYIWANILSHYAQLLLINVQAAYPDRIEFYFLV